MPEEPLLMLQAHTGSAVKLGHETLSEYVCIRGWHNYIYMSSLTFLFTVCPHFLLSSQMKTACYSKLSAHLSGLSPLTLRLSPHFFSQVYSGAERASRVTSPWCAETQLESRWREVGSMSWSASFTRKRKTGEWMIEPSLHWVFLIHLVRGKWQAAY